MKTKLMMVGLLLSIFYIAYEDEDGNGDADCIEMVFTK